MSAITPIVLKKSFLPDEQKFLEPLMRFARPDVRDHISSHKNDHGPSHPSCRAMQGRWHPKILLAIVRALATQTAVEGRSGEDEFLIAMELAAAHRIIAPHPERLEKLSISGQDTAGLVNHEERLFKGVYDPLRLGMFAA